MRVEVAVGSAYCYPVVQTKGSSLRSAGRLLLRASIMSMFSLRSMWHLANLLLTSLTPGASLDRPPSTFFCRSVRLCVTELTLESHSLTMRVMAPCSAATIVARTRRCSSYLCSILLRGEGSSLDTTSCPCMMGVKLGISANLSSSRLGVLCSCSLLLTVTMVLCTLEASWLLLLLSALPSLAPLLFFLPGTVLLGLSPMGLFTV